MRLLKKQDLSQNESIEATDKLPSKLNIDVQGMMFALVWSCGNGLDFPSDMPPSELNFNHVHVACLLKQDSHKLGACEETGKNLLTLLC